MRRTIPVVRSSAPGSRTGSTCRTNASPSRRRSASRRSTRPSRGRWLPPVDGGVAGGCLLRPRGGARPPRGQDVSLWALPEGSLFPPRTSRGIPVPVFVVEGPYGEWAMYETPLLGMVCQASGIATKAARIRKLADGKQVLSFGVRRMHPGIAPMIERSVYIGGLDAITTPLGADLLGAPAMGTMPHALVIVMGGPRGAFAAGR